jgi:hypothetical protein
VKTKQRKKELKYPRRKRKIRQNNFIRQKTHTHKRTNVYGRGENRARTPLTIDKWKSSSIQTPKSCCNYWAGNYVPAVDSGPDEYTILHPYDGSINTTRENVFGCTYIRLMEVTAHFHVLVYYVV